MEYTLEQANSVISDKSNPDYQKFYVKQDRQVVDAVHRAFERSHPGELEIGGGELPAHLNDALNSELGVKTSETPAEKPAGETVKFSEAWDYTPAQSEAALRQVWGDQFETKMARLKDPESFRTVFSGYLTTPERHRVLEETFKILGNHSGVLELYDYLIEQKTGSQP